MDILKRLTVVGTCAFAVLFTVKTGGNLFSNAKHPAESGTFQFISNPANRNEISKEMEDSLRVVFESKRDPEKLIILDINANTKAIILPKKEIDERNFKPLEEFVDGNVRLIANESRK